MSKPVNMIRIKLGSRKTKYSDLFYSAEIVVDHQTLEQHLVDALKVNVGSHVQWSERSDVIVCLEALHESLDQEGQHMVLVSAGCLVLGYRDCDDVSLDPFDVFFEDDMIIWRTSLPGRGIDHEWHQKLVFRFHRPQITKALSTVPRKTRKH